MNAPSLTNVGSGLLSDDPHGNDSRDDDWGIAIVNLDAEAQRLAGEIGDALAKRGETLAVGETSAGGELAGMIHAAGGHAWWFRGGIVVYAGGAAPIEKALQDVARQNGVVSEQYVTALAQCVRRAFSCDWALAESGIAGPQTGRRSAKPVGMVCLAVVGPSRKRAPAKERGTSPRAMEDPGDVKELALGLESTPIVTATTNTGRQSLWTTKHEIADSGRTANQHQFAVAALRLFLRVLEAYR